MNSRRSPETRCGRSARPFLADASIAAGAPVLAEILYDELEPHAGRNLMAGMTVCVGPADRYLGRLASMLGDSDKAESCFASALAMAQCSGSPLWQAQVLIDWARLTQPRSPRLARQRATDALRHAERSGLSAVAAQCRHVLEN